MYPSAARKAALAAAIALLLAGCSEPAPPAPYDVTEVSITQLGADMAGGRTTAVAITNGYIERIKKYDGPLNSVLAIAPDAVQQAEASDARRKAGKTLGPMDGIPILLKDNIDALGMATTGGSYAFIDNIPVKDSEVSRRLRDAGAVILGKVNLSQFAGWRGTRGMLSGTTVGGTPTNPYRLGWGTAGSSSGNGVATAASFAAASVGSDTTGSIIGPSALQGLVGMRPTIALISRRGVIPISTTQDTTGPMARSVTDAAILLTVIAGSDPADPDSAEADANKKDYVKGLDANALKGARLGVVRGTTTDRPESAPVFDAALKMLEAQGATLVDIPVTFFEDLYPEQHTLLHYTFREDLEAYLKDAPPQVKVRNLADLVGFSKSDQRESGYVTELWDMDLINKGRSEPNFASMLEYARRRAGPEGLGAAMTQNNVTALVMMGGGPAQQQEPPTGGPSTYTTMPEKGTSKISPSGIAAMAGYPDIVFPIGHVDGMPVGMSLIGPKWSEQHLLSLAYAYEQVAKARVPPADYLKAAADAAKPQ